MAKCQQQQKARSAASSKIISEDNRVDPQSFMITPCVPFDLFSLEKYFGLQTSRSPQGSRGKRKGTETSRLNKVVVR